MSERIKSLEQEVARHKEDSGKAQAEVDRLLEILREMENEKNDKDKKINELERWVYHQQHCMLMDVCQFTLKCFTCNCVFNGQIGYLSSSFAFWFHFSFW